MKDILGKALLDYYSGNADTDIITETNISEEDNLPLAYLFRNYSEMPLIEQKALELAKGRVLDVGCGSGRTMRELSKRMERNYGTELHISGIDKDESILPKKRHKQVWGKVDVHYFPLSLEESTFVDQDLVYSSYNTIGMV